MAADEYFTVWQAPFTALITGKELVPQPSSSSSGEVFVPAPGTWVYSWQEQYVDPATGEYVTLYGGRNGTYSLSYATELNNNEIPVFQYRRLWFKSEVVGQPIFEFEDDACGCVKPSSSSSSSGCAVSTFCGPLPCILCLTVTDDQAGDCACLAGTYQLVWDADEEEWFWEGTLCDGGSDNAQITLEATTDPDTGFDAFKLEITCDGENFVSWWAVTPAQFEGYTPPDEGIAAEYQCSPFVIWGDNPDGTPSVCCTGSYSWSITPCQGCLCDQLLDSTPPVIWCSLTSPGCLNAECLVMPFVCQEIAVVNNGWQSETLDLCGTEVFVQVSCPDLSGGTYVIINCGGTQYSQYVLFGEPVTFPVDMSSPCFQNSVVLQISQDGCGGSSSSSQSSAQSSSSSQQSSSSSSQACCGYTGCVQVVSSGTSDCACFDSSPATILPSCGTDCFVGSFTIGGGCAGTMLLDISCTTGAYLLEATWTAAFIYSATTFMTVVSCEPLQLTATIPNFGWTSDGGGDQPCAGDITFTLTAASCPSSSSSSSSQQSSSSSQQSSSSSQHSSSSSSQQSSSSSQHSSSSSSQQSSSSSSQQSSSSSSQQSSSSSSQQSSSSSGGSCLTCEDLAFNGSNQSGTGSDASLPSGTVAKSISLWAKPSAYSNGCSAFAYGNDISSYTAITMAGTSGAPYWLGWIGNIEVGNSSHGSNNNIVAGNWYHLVVMSDGTSQCKLYVNNVLIATSNSDPSVTLSSFYIASDGFNEYYPGELFDIRVYNIGLTSTQVSEIYNGGTPSFCDATVGSNIVGWWKLVDGSGSTAVDSSGNGHNATLHNSPTWTADCP